MLVQILDFETSGLVPETDLVIEVGSCLVDWDTQSILRVESYFVNHDISISEEITRLTGITNEMLGKYGIDSRCGLEHLLALMDEADVVATHNGAQFDRLFFNEWCNDLEVDQPPDKIWLDTTIDIAWPAAITTRKLNYLAAELGLVNPFKHRAVFDALTTYMLLAKHDIQQVIEFSRIPFVHLMATVDFDNNKLAKDRMFRWSPERRIWWKKVRECYVAEEAAYWQSTKFQCRKIDGAGLK